MLREEGQLTGVDERRAVASYAETDIRRVGIRAHARGVSGVSLSALLGGFGWWRISCA